MSHGYSVQRSIIVLPIFISAKRKQFKLQICMMSSHKPLPVTLIRQRDVRRKPPLTHLQHTDEKQRMDPHHTRRNSHHSKWLSSALSRVAEVERVRESLEISVELHGALD